MKFLWSCLKLLLICLQELAFTSVRPGIRIIALPSLIRSQHQLTCEYSMVEQSAYLLNICPLEQGFCYYNSHELSDSSWVTYKHIWHFKEKFSWGSNCKWVNIAPCSRSGTKPLSGPTSLTPYGLTYLPLERWHHLAGHNFKCQVRFEFPWNFEIWSQECNWQHWVR